MVTRRRRESLVAGLQREAREATKTEIDRRAVTERARLRDVNAALQARVKSLEIEVADLESAREALDYVNANPARPLTIKTREPKSRVHEATACLLLSDLHLEERVDPAEVNGMNEFNLEIAIDRMERLAVGFVWNLELALSKYKIRELWIPMLGDITTNYLHPEDVAGNALAPLPAVVFAEQQLSKFYRTILARCPTIERIHAPIVPGNHDRMSWTRKTQFRGRTAMSTAPLFAHMLCKEFRDESRIRFELATGEHHYSKIYERDVRGCHGDRFNYAGGVGGIFIPARRWVSAINKIKHAHLTTFGHWHTSKTDDLWISNGSLIGLNAYSLGKGLDPEPPSQTFFLLDKSRGKRIVTPIQVSAVEGWS